MKSSRGFRGLAVLFPGRRRSADGDARFVKVDGRLSAALTFLRFRGQPELTMSWLRLFDDAETVPFAVLATERDKTGRLS